MRDSTLTSWLSLRKPPPPRRRRAGGSLLFLTRATRAIASRKRGLTSSSQALMHSPLSTQELAHLRAASGPSPVRTMSSTPVMTACGEAVTPAASVIGHTSTHLPQRVQESTIWSTRALKADSQVMLMGRHASSDAGVGPPCRPGTDAAVRVYGGSWVRKRRGSG